MKTTVQKQEDNGAFIYHTPTDYIWIPESAHARKLSKVTDSNPIVSLNKEMLSLSLDMLFKLLKTDRNEFCESLLNEVYNSKFRFEIWEEIYFAIKNDEIESPTEDCRKAMSHFDKAKEEWEAFIQILNSKFPEAVEYSGARQNELILMLHKTHKNWLRELIKYDLQVHKAREELEEILSSEETYRYYFEALKSAHSKLKMCERSIVVYAYMKGIKLYILEPIASDNSLLILKNESQVTTPRKISIMDFNTDGEKKDFILYLLYEKNTHKLFTLKNSALDLSPNKLEAESPKQTQKVKTSPPQNEVPSGIWLSPTMQQTNSSYLSSFGCQKIYIELGMINEDPRSLQRSILSLYPEELSKIYATNLVITTIKLSKEKKYLPFIKLLIKNANSKSNDEAIIKVFEKHKETYLGIAALTQRFNYHSFNSICFIIEKITNFINSLPSNNKITLGGEKDYFHEIFKFCKENKNEWIEMSFTKKIKKDLKKPLMIYHENLDQWLTDLSARFEDLLIKILLPFLAKDSQELDIAKHEVFGITSLKELQNVTVKLSAKKLLFDVYCKRANDQLHKILFAHANDLSAVNASVKIENHKLINDIVHSKNYPLTFSRGISIKLLDAWTGIVNPDYKDPKTENNLALLAIQYKNPLIYTHLRDTCHARNDVKNKNGLCALYYIQAEGKDTDAKTIATKELQKDIPNKLLREIEIAMYKYADQWAKRAGAWFELENSNAIGDRILFRIMGLGERLGKTQTIFFDRPNALRDSLGVVDEAAESISPSLYKDIEAVLKSSQWGLTGSAFNSILKKALKMIDNNRRVFELYTSDDHHKKVSREYQALETKYNAEVEKNKELEDKILELKQVHTNRIKEIKRGHEEEIKQIREESKKAWEDCKRAEERSIRAEEKSEKAIQAVEAIMKMLQSNNNQIFSAAPISKDPTFFANVNQIVTRTKQNNSSKQEEDDESLEQLFAKAKLEKINEALFNVIFNDSEDAKAFTKALFKVGIENPGMKGAERKMEISKNINDNSESFIIRLSAVELDAVGQNRNYSNKSLVTQVNDRTPSFQQK